MFPKVMNVLKQLNQLPRCEQGYKAVEEFKLVTSNDIQILCCDGKCVLYCSGWINSLSKPAEKDTKSSEEKTTTELFKTDVSIKNELQVHDIVGHKGSEKSKIVYAAGLGAAAGEAISSLAIFDISAWFK